jgi:hypothetical protein
MNRVDKIHLIKNIATHLATMDELTATILLREFNWPYSWYLEGNFNEKSRAVVDFLQNQSDLVLEAVSENILQMGEIPIPYEANIQNENARIRIFMSHKKEFRQIASEFKKLLDLEFFDTFVAHEDIKDNEFWKESIKEDLSGTNVLVALVTDQFENSVWCQQEIGWAMSREILTIGISFREPVPPLGFLGEKQLIKFIDYTNAVSRIKNLILDNEELRKLWRRSVLKEIGESVNWNHVRHYWRSISTFEQLDEYETKLLRSAIENNEYVATVSINYGENGADVKKYLENFGT